MLKHPGQIEIGDHALNDFRQIIWTCVDEPLFVPPPADGFRDVKITVKFANGFIGPLWFYSTQRLEVQ